MHIKAWAQHIMNLMELHWIYVISFFSLHVQYPTAAAGWLKLNIFGTNQECVFHLLKESF